MSWFADLEQRLRSSTNTHENKEPVPGRRSLVGMTDEDYSGKSTTSGTKYALPPPTANEPTEVTNARRLLEQTENVPARRLEIVRRVLELADHSMPAVAEPLLRLIAPFGVEYPAIASVVKTRLAQLHPHDTGTGTRASLLDAAQVAEATAFNARSHGTVEAFIAATHMFASASEIDVEKVAKWQEQHGLVPDGKIGNGTAQKAQSLATSPAATKITPADTSDATSGGTTYTPTDGKPYVSSGSGAGEPGLKAGDNAPRVVIRKGDHGKDVLELKRLLISKGFQSRVYPLDPSNDKFDRNEVIAAERFQWAHGLPLRELVDEQMWSLIQTTDATVESAALAVGKRRARRHGDWGADAPVAAKPGEYGDTWAMTEAGQIRLGGDQNWRYCNPGNIRPGATYSWSHFGITALNVAQPSALAIFRTWDEGWHALHELLLGGMYRDEKVDGFTQVYLGGKTSNFNDSSAAYTESVVSSTGLDRDRKIKDLNESELRDVMLAIRKVEGTTEGKIIRPGAAPPLLAHAFDSE